MLDQLLSILERGGLHTPTELAARLEVSEQLVQQMLADLARMGYLRSVSNPGCQMPSEEPSIPCASCPLSDACNLNCGPGSQLWALTDKRANELRKKA